MTMLSNMKYNDQGRLRWMSANECWFLDGDEIINEKQALGELKRALKLV